MRNGVDINSSPISVFLQKLQEHGFEIVRDYDPTIDYKYGISLGGDGTFLRIAEKLRGKYTPILGINFGNVGFLADFDVRSIDSIADSLVQGDLTVKQRYPIEAECTLPNGLRSSGWAINEAALEKSEKMLNLKLDINHAPFSSYGCDGVIVSTATGSTAHAFSAGGPIIYPDVECFELLPIAAHALFTRPVILDKSAVVDINICEGSSTLTFDGARVVELPSGSRIRAFRSNVPINFAELPLADKLSELSHTRKLVNRFKLPVQSFGTEQ